MGKEHFIYIIYYIYNLLFIVFAPYFNKTDYRLLITFTSALKGEGVDAQGLAEEMI